MGRMRIEIRRKTSREQSRGLVNGRPLVNSIVRAYEFIVKRGWIAELARHAMAYKVPEEGGTLARS